MDQNNKEYIVTKIEKYDEMFEDTDASVMQKCLINLICTCIFLVLYRNTFTFTILPEYLDDGVVNQILDDVSLFGVAITSYNGFANLAKLIKSVYAAIMSQIWNNKLQKNDIENQTGTLTIENNEGKTR